MGGGFGYPPHTRTCSTSARRRERLGEIPTDHLPRTCNCERGALPPSHSTRPTRAIVVSHQALADARSDIHAFLIAAWDTLLQHRLPPYSLSSTNLAHFLARIRLPSNHALPLPLTARNMHAYYSLIRAHPVASATQLFVYLHIPLVEASKHFTVYRVHQPEGSWKERSSHLPYSTLLSTISSRRGRSSS